MRPFYTFLSLSILTLCSHTFAQDLIPSQQPHLKGYWKFQNPNNLTKASIGNDLKLVGSHQWVPGPEQKDTAVRIGLGSYYKCYHQISPNGGDSVNRYTLMFDFKVDNLDRWHTFFQTDTNNLNDGECFIRPKTESNPGRIGTATTGYTPVSINTKQWYRLVISVNLGSYYRYYLNGQLILDGNNQDTDDRFAMNPYVLLFADNNQEDDTMDIASVAIFDTCLSHSEVAALGTVDPCILYPLSLNLGNDTTLCGSSSLVKHLNKGQSYKWSTGDTDSTLTFNVNKLGLGTKTIWAEIKDKNGCIKRDTFVLSIYNNPSLNLGKDTSFCEGPSYRLVAGPASGNTYEWRHLPSGIVVSKTNAMTTDSSGVYVVRMTNSNGCMAFDSVQITVHEIPDKPSITYNSLELCQGDTFHISGPIGMAKYHWSDGHTVQGFSKATDGGLLLRVQTAFGCLSPPSDSLIFKLNPLPNTPDIQFSPDTAFCEGDSILLFIQGNFTTITWSDGYPLASRRVKSSGQFRVRISDANNCQSGWSEELSTTSLSRPDKPEIISAKGLKFCDGDSAILVCQSNADNILWSNGPKTSQITVKSGGKLHVSTYNDNGCYSLEQDSIDIAFFSIPAKPEIEIYYPDSLRSSLPGHTYQWYFNITDTLDDTTRTISFNNGNYGLRIRNEYCWSYREDTLINFVDEIRNPRFQSVNLYPNPICDNQKLRLDNLADIILGIQVYSNQGQLIIKHNGSIDSLDISNLASGTYTLLIFGEKNWYRATLARH